MRSPEAPTKGSALYRDQETMKWLCDTVERHSKIYHKGRTKRSRLDWPLTGHEGMMSPQLHFKRRMRRCPIDPQRSKESSHAMNDPMHERKRQSPILLSSPMTCDTHFPYILYRSRGAKTLSVEKAKANRLVIHTSHSLKWMEVKTTGNWKSFDCFAGILSEKERLTTSWRVSVGRIWKSWELSDLLTAIGASPFY